MAMTFPFRGPIPDWLNPDTAGHRYWKPAEVPVKFAGRELLDGASAIYAFAPEHVRLDLVAADEALRLLGVPTDPDRKQTLQWIEYLHREDQEVIPEQTPEFQAWCRWKVALNIVPMHIVLPLMDGKLRAFGEPNWPGSHPYWIDPRTWLALEADPVIQGKFSGHDLVFWNVRLVDTVEIMAEHERQERQSSQPQRGKVTRKNSSKNVERWFIEYKKRFINDRFHPSLKEDMAAARRELNECIPRSEIESLRREFINPERLPIGRRPNPRSNSHGE